MNSKNRKLKARENWIKLYKELGSVSKAAKRCGIPRSTLYRSINRYETGGENSLVDRISKTNKISSAKNNRRDRKAYLITSPTA